MRRDETSLIAAGEVTKAVIGLPIHCLRLPDDTIKALRVLGVETVGELRPCRARRSPWRLSFRPS